MEPHLIMLHHPGCEEHQNYLQTWIPGKA